MTVLTGIFRQPYKAQLLVSASAKFQEITAATGDEDAMRFTRYPHADPDSGDRPPLAILFVDHERARYERRKLAPGLWSTSGSLFLQFIFTVPRSTLGAAEPSEIDAESAAWMMSQCGQIMLEMENLAGQGNPIGIESHFNMEGYTPSAGPEKVNPMDSGFITLDDIEEGRADPDDMNIWATEFELEWQ